MNQSIMTVIRILVYFLNLFLDSPILNGFGFYSLAIALRLLLVFTLCVPILDLPSETLTFVPTLMVVYLQPLQVAVFCPYWNASYAPSIRPTLLVLFALRWIAIDLSPVTFKCCSAFTLLALPLSQVRALSTAASPQPPTLECCLLL